MQQVIELARAARDHAQKHAQEEGSLKELQAKANAPRGGFFGFGKKPAGPFL